MLAKISFKNYGPFKEAELSLAPLTVIVGPNASGKSMTLAAVNALLDGGTHDFPRDEAIHKGSNGSEFEVEVSDQNGNVRTWSDYHQMPYRSKMLRLEPRVMRWPSSKPEIREDGFGLASLLANMKLLDAIPPS